MPKKKDHIPKNMTDLEEIFYGSDIERRRRYYNHLRTTVKSPMHEEMVDKLFASLGRVDKIPKSPKPTFDYEIASEKMLIEVTSLNVDEAPPIIRMPNKKGMLEKLDAKVEHILEKDTSKYPDYRKGGVIFYSILVNVGKRFNRILDQTLPERSRMLNNLDFLIFLHEPGVINGIDSWEIYPPIFYMKDKTLCMRLRNSVKDVQAKFFSRQGAKWILV